MLKLLKRLLLGDPDELLRRSRSFALRQLLAATKIDRIS